MLDLLEPLLFIAATAALIWSGFRAWQAENRILKWSGTVLATLVSAVAAVISMLLVVGVFKLHARSAPSVALKIESTPEQIRRGQDISDGFCAGCHSKWGILTGGGDIGEDLPMRVGHFVPPNLTPAGDLAGWSDGDIFRAVRNGVGRDGRWLIIMSYTNAGKLSDDDIRAVIAYLRSVPAAGAKLKSPPDRLNTLGVMMLGAGMLPAGKPVSKVAITAPPSGPTARYGEYILSYQDCRECHGKDLTGGVLGQLAPVGPDLNLVKDWTFEQFAATLHTGVDPYGHEIGKQMPWRPIGRMSDEELRAIYEYLMLLPKA
jgi:mono/diheme cytochrome c family protein